jgi:hypothetical protein
MSKNEQKASAGINSIKFNYSSGISTALDAYYRGFFAA